MPQAKPGDRVKVHYTGKLQDGTVFDTSVGREPLQFSLGSGQIIPGFEEAVIGMDEGETKTTEVPPEKAYGPHRDDLVQEVPKEQLPQGFDPEVGQQLQARSADGQVIPVWITDVQDETVILDANHPLAGKELLFDIELVEVQ